MLFDRLRRREQRPGSSRGLARDARAMRVALASLHSERGEPEPVDLRALLHDLLEGEIAAPTADIATLKRRDVDPREFYDHEIAASWDELSESQRAARLDGLMELCAMLATAGPADLASQMGPAVRTKTLMLAWAFDQTYGYLKMVERGELP